MADLPLDRTEVCPPFTNIGFDVFGPWAEQTRKTRGGGVNAKRLGLVFICLSSRAIHIEVLEAMDSSAFICALRRFFALRGHAKLLRCDRGTNFVGAKMELDAAASELNEKKVEKFVTECGCKWEFNPPHASHFGGVWERQINMNRRVLDAMFTELGQSQVTHELLVTLMAEVVALVNARPIAVLPSDTDDPQPLSPAMLLTMKTRPAGPSRPVHADRYLCTPSLETSPVPCETILDQVEERIRTEPTAAKKVDGDAAGPVCRRYRSCARRITTP